MPTCHVRFRFTCAPDDLARRLPVRPAHLGKAGAWTAPLTARVWSQTL